MSEHSAQTIMAELKGFRDLMEERTGSMQERLDRIHEQVTKTNGRVTSCELELAENRGRAKIQGGLWGALTSIVVAVTAFIINKSIYE